MEPLVQLLAALLVKMLELLLHPTTTTLSYSQTNSAINCPRDVMKALTNIPGYRYDFGNGIVYYTEELFDKYGNFKQVTISRPVNGLYN